MDPSPAHRSLRGPRFPARNCPFPGQDRSLREPLIATADPANFHTNAEDFMTDQIIAEAYSFDDVLLVPSYSDVLPKDVDTRTRLTRELT
jgi:hypothetical protein